MIISDSLGTLNRHHTTARARERAGTRLESFTK
jgi:hypothetical protein